ncbi:hypothetical protein EJB05_00801, partial [Eragrostis curvula]
RFGYTDRPEYRSLSFVQDGTQYCEVQVTVLQPRARPDLEPMTVTAFGTQFGDAHQIAARKTLLLFCQRHEEEVRDTPCRYFPLYEHTEAQWQYRLSALQGPDQREEDPTVVASAWYIMAMDKVAPAPAPTEEAPVPAPAPAPAYGFLSESDEEPSEEEDAQMAEDDPELELLEDPLQGEEDTETEHEMDYPTDNDTDYSGSMDEDDFPEIDLSPPHYDLVMEEVGNVVNFWVNVDDQPVVIDPPPQQEPAPVAPPAQQQPAPVAPPAQQQPAPVAPPTQQEPAPVAPAAQQQPVLLVPPAHHQLALVAPPAAQHPLALVALGPLFPYQPVLAPPTAQHYPAAPQQAPQMLGDADLFEYYQLLRAHEEWSDPYDLYRAWRRDHEEQVLEEGAEDPDYEDLEEEDFVGIFLAGAGEVVLNGEAYLRDAIPPLRIAIEDAYFGRIRTGSCAALPSTFRTTTCLEWEKFGTTPYYSVHPVPTWRAGVAAEARRKLDIAGVGIRHMCFRGGAVVTPSSLYKVFVSASDPETGTVGTSAPEMVYDSVGASVEVADHERAVEGAEAAEEAISGDHAAP